MKPDLIPLKTIEKLKLQKNQIEKTIAEINYFSNCNFFNIMIILFILFIGIFLFYRYIQKTKDNGKIEKKTYQTIDSSIFQ